MKDAWTYCKQRGGNVLHKALAHPRCAGPLAALRSSKVAVHHLMVIDDRTCRLFGCHGLREADGFSMDHLFGF